MKLCSECYKTKEQKRNRNIFLSNLVLCMQNGALGEPFTLPSYEVDVSESAKYFGDPQVELEVQRAKLPRKTLPNSTTVSGPTVAARVARKSGGIPSGTQRWPNLRGHESHAWGTRSHGVRGRDFRPRRGQVARRRRRVRHPKPSKQPRENLVSERSTSTSRESSGKWYPSRTRWRRS